MRGWCNPWQQKSLQNAAGVPLSLGSTALAPAVRAHRLGHGGAGCTAAGLRSCRQSKAVSVCSQRSPGCRLKAPAELFPSSQLEPLVCCAGTQCYCRACSNAEIIERCDFGCSCQFYLPTVDRCCSFTILNLLLHQKTLNPVIMCSVPDFLSIFFGKIVKTVVPDVGK